MLINIGAPPQGYGQNKGVPTGWHCGGISLTFSGKAAQIDTSLKCLHTNGCSMGKKWEELEVHVQFQGCNLTGIAEMH